MLAVILMDTIYYIFLLTFLGYPIIALILSKFITLDKVSKLIKPTILFFFTHNILFAFGYSLKGDYVDYYVFSFEYLVFCLTVVLLFKTTNTYAKIFRVLGTIAISLGFIIGLFGIFIFIVISQDYKTNKIFYFENNSKTYETRRYTFGFVSSADTRYTFETYRTYKYFPFEKKIDRTDFFDDKTDLQISENDLKISVVDLGDQEQILFKSTNGHTFSKALN